MQKLVKPVSIDVSALAHPIVEINNKIHFPSPVPTSIGIIGPIAPMIAENIELKIFFFLGFSLISCSSEISAILQTSK